MGIPRGVILAMLRTDTRRRTVGTTKHHRRAHLPAGHIERLGRRIHDLVDRLHGKVEGHELYNRAQPAKGRPDRDPGKAMLGDRRVDDALAAEFVEQPLGDLVGPLIFRDLFAHQIDVGVAPHFLGHCVAQGLANRLGAHLGAIGPIRGLIGFGNIILFLRIAFGFRRGRRLVGGLAALRCLLLRAAL